MFWVLTRFINFYFVISTNGRNHISCSLPLLLIVALVMRFASPVRALLLGLLRRNDKRKVYCF